MAGDEVGEMVGVWSNGTLTFALKQKTIPLVLEGFEHKVKTCTVVYKRVHSRATVYT